MVSNLTFARNRPSCKIREGSYCILVTMPVKTLHLIGGAPLTGKSTLSKKQGYSNCIATDWVESWMKTVAKREDYPHVFYTYGHTVETFYAQYTTPMDTVHDSILAGQDVTRFIVPLLTNEDCRWDEVAIEGVFITPEFARHLKKTLPKTTITTTFLYVENEQLLKKRLETRGLWSRKEKHPQWVLDKELAYVTAYNTWFKEQAAKHGFDIVTVTNDLPIWQRLFK